MDRNSARHSQKGAPMEQKILYILDSNAVRWSDLAELEVIRLFIASSVRRRLQHFRSIKPFPVVSGSLTTNLAF